MSDTPSPAGALSQRSGKGLAAAGCVGIAAWAGLAVLMLFAMAMTGTVTYDEDQYIAAGVMARHLMPFRDFAYLQAPLYPFVLAPLFSLTDGWFLLTGRLLTFVLSVGSGVLLWHLVRRLGAGLILSMVLLTACLTSPFLNPPLSNTRNDILPLFLMLAGLAVHLWAVKRSWWGRAGAALLFGLAVEAKVSYLFGPIALGVHAMFAPRLRLPPLLLGLAGAALPALFCWIVAPDALRFGLLDFHLIGPADWYGREGLAPLMTPWARLQALADWSAVGGSLTLMLLAAVLAMLATARKRNWKRPGRLLLGLTIGAAIFGFVPSPSWAMYYAAVPPLLACCVAHLDQITTQLAGAPRKRILVGVAALPMIPILVLMAPNLVRLADPPQWAGIAANRHAEAIRAIVGGGEVATLFPRQVIDANPVRPDFATGPFIFRSGDRFSPALLTRLHALSPATLEAAFDAAPPAAIYAGLYPQAWKVQMDAALITYAEQHGWHLALTEPGGGRLWLRP